MDAVTIRRKGWLLLGVLLLAALAVVYACCFRYRAVMVGGVLVHRHVFTTMFWVGEAATADNDYISNSQSAWDDNWRTHFGGTDDPQARHGWLPAAFTPRENPFYCALPYNDYTDNNARKPEAAHIIPWGRIWPGGTSLCKNHWVQITAHGRTVYAQWEDSGPFEYNDAAYVFGTRPPASTHFLHAGLDVSPAVNDYLHLGNGWFTDWHFVNAHDVPPARGGRW